MTDEIRPEAVRAVLDAGLDGGLDGLAAVGPLSTAEAARARHALVNASVETDDRAQQTSDAVLILAAGSGYRAGLSLGEAWAVLSDADRARMAELYDALPAELRPHVDAWRAER